MKRGAPSTPLQDVVKQLKFDSVTTNMQDTPMSSSNVTKSRSPWAGIPYSLPTVEVMPKRYTEHRKPYLSRKNYGTIRVKRGSVIPGTDTTTTDIFGTSWNDATPQQRYAREQYGYTGQGAYRRRRMRRLRSSGLRLRRYKRYRGRGGYWGRLLGGLVGRPEWGDRIGDAAGMVIKNFVPGGGLMMQAADYAGRAHRVMTGQGGYDENIVHNDLIMKPSVIPSFSAVPDGASITVSHHEYIGDVVGPATAGGFVNKSYQINPGLESTFPWLSQIACNYEEYDLKQCMFYYRSTTTDIGSSSNGQCGTLIMATNYNASSDPFSDKQEMMEYDGAMSSKTTQDQEHGIECDPKKLSGSPGKYVRYNPVVVNQDLKSYDHAQFNIAVNNIPAGYINQSLGELWIVYTVELRKPKFVTSRGLAISRDVYVSSAGSTSVGPATNLLLGTQANLLSGQQNNIGTEVNCTTRTITLPPNYAGNLRLTYSAVTIGGLAHGLTNITAAVTGNVTGVNDVYATQGGSDSPLSAVLAISTAQIIFIQDFRITPVSNGVQNTIQLNFSGIPSNQWQEIQLDINEYNASFNYKQNGTNDSIVLVNNGGVVTIP